MLEDSKKHYGEREKIRGTGDVCNDFIPRKQCDRRISETYPAKSLSGFGFGFYTTTNRDQAVNFAQKVTDRRKTGAATLNIYSVEEEVAFKECSLLRFYSPDEAWLDFVAVNRQGTYQGEQHDLIYGAVANDDVYRTITLYMTGVLDKEQTLAALKIRKLFNQLVFATEKSLQYLHFEGRELV